MSGEPSGRLVSPLAGTEVKHKRTEEQDPTIRDVLGPARSRYQVNPKVSDKNDSSVVGCRINDAIVLFSSAELWGGMHLPLVQCMRKGGHHQETCDRPCASHIPGVQRITFLLLPRPPPPVARCVRLISLNRCNPGRTREVQDNEVKGTNPGCHLVSHRFSPSHPEKICCSTRSQIISVSAGSRAEEKLMNLNKTAFHTLGLSRGTPLIHVN